MEQKVQGRVKRRKGLFHGAFSDETGHETLLKQMKRAGQIGSGVAKGVYFSAGIC
jgi:hypothetical protein